MRLFRNWNGNWNSQCCKCQAFITHNLFISLHIKLVNVVSFTVLGAQCCESDQGCMQTTTTTTMMNDFTAQNSVCAITFPAVALVVYPHVMLLSYEQFLPSSFHWKRSKKNKKKRKFNTQQLPNKSFSSSSFPVGWMCSWIFLNLLIRSRSWFNSSQYLFQRVKKHESNCNSYCSRNIVCSETSNY